MRDKHVPDPGKVLEVGSCDVNGSPRTVFEVGAEKYTGVDLVPGKGVDVVLDILDGFSDTPLRHEIFDTVICAETLEHVADPIRAVKVMRHHLKPNGHLILTSPANGVPEHKFPRDYWRLMPDAYTDVLLHKMQILDFSTVRFKDHWFNCFLAKEQP